MTFAKILLALAALGLAAPFASAQTAADYNRYAGYTAPPPPPPP
ncbi:MAG: hypothetical protein RJB58_2017, partial [Pseudomonadota bacterium]